jgi:hypothetical protein
VEAVKVGRATDTLLSELQTQARRTTRAAAAPANPEWRRVPCVPFRENDRRGYRFRQDEIPYSGVLSNDVGGPNGIRAVVGLDLAFSISSSAVRHQRIDQKI